MAIFAGLLIPLSLLLDIYIYFALLRRQSGVVKVAYALVAAIIYLLILSPWLFTVKDFYVVVWLMWPYFVFTLTKATFVATSLIGDLLSLFVVIRRTFRIVGVALAMIVALVLLSGTFYGRTHLRVENLVIESAKIPRSFNDYRIAFFSDLHAGSLGDSELIGDLADAINRSEIDLVLFGGDMVNSQSEEVDSQMVELLSSFKAVDGVYSVLGNHDLGIYLRDTSESLNAKTVVRDLLSKQSDMGWRTLVNQTAYLVRGEDKVALSGVMFPSKGRNNARHKQILECDLSATYEGVSDTLYNIVLSHTPELWPTLTMMKGRADLTLSGHTHAMQSKLTLGKRVFSPAKWIYRFFSGLYYSSEDIDNQDLGVADQWAPLLNAPELDGENILEGAADKLLYVNDGLGYVLLPMRIGCRPELTIITLKSIY